jgi:hypothetical protein
MAVFHDIPSAGDLAGAGPPTPATRPPGGVLDSPGAEFAATGGCSRSLRRESYGSHRTGRARLVRDGGRRSDAMGGAPNQARDGRFEAGDSTVVLAGLWPGKY